MADHIEKVRLDRPTIEENMAVLDKWISDTADAMNHFISVTNKKLNEMRKENEHGSD